MTGDDALVAAARAWRDQDPDVETRDELDAVVAAAETGDADAVADLHDRFDTRLAFGTTPNPDADDGTSVGTFLDVSRP